MIRKSKWFAFACAALVLSQQASGHHGENLFDRSRPMTLTGTIRLFRWSNPHTWLYVDVPNANGQQDEWVLQAPSVAVLNRYGWNSHALQAGDKVIVQYAPRRDGKLGGQMMTVTLPGNGRVLTYGAKASE
jgi:Family of unknown function (DUF6152)